MSRLKNLSLSRRSDSRLSVGLQTKEENLHCGRRHVTKKLKLLSVVVCMSVSRHYISPFDVMRSGQYSDSYEIGVPRGIKAAFSETGYMKWE